MINRFDELAQKWDSKVERVESAMAFVDYIKSTINKDISDFKVCDYGCGSGLVSFGFIDNVKSIVGFDYSLGMIEKYNEKIKKLNYTHISAIQHNIDNEVLPKNEFDLVTTNMTMHHIKDTSTFINRLKDSLKIGGYIFISDLISEDGGFHSMGNDDVEHLGFDKDELIQEFENIGLTEITFTILQVINKPQGDYPIFVISGKVK